MLWINLLILLLAIPTGLIIAWMTRDELVMYRKYFRILFIVGIIMALWFWLIKNILVSLTIWFAVIVVLISLVLSGNKKFVK